jgi:hypothetical protein
MRLLVQDHTGHATLTAAAMTDEQMRAEFDRLIKAGYFASTGTLENAVQVKSWDEAVAESKARATEDILLCGPQQGG